jgi:hypothetical protein
MREFRRLISNSDESTDQICFVPLLKCGLKLFEHLYAHQLASKSSLESDWPLSFRTGTCFLPSSSLATSFKTSLRTLRCHAHPGQLMDRLTRHLLSLQAGINPTPTFSPFPCEEQQWEPLTGPQLPRKLRPMLLLEGRRPLSRGTLLSAWSMGGLDKLSPSRTFDGFVRDETLIACERDLSEAKIIVAMVSCFLLLCWHKGGDRFTGRATGKRQELFKQQAAALLEGWLMVML